MTTFTADTTEFRTAVCKVARVVPERAPVPVLGGILLVAGDGAVEVLATDYQVTHRATVPAEVKVPGRVLVKADVLARIARNLPAGEVAVELDRVTLTLACGRTRYSLLTMPEDDYPKGLPADADLSRVRAAGADGQERELAVPKPFARWKPPSRTRTLYDPQGVQPGASITWFRKVGEEWVEVSGQVWSGAPTSRAVWALVEGERRPSLVVEHTYGDRRLEETKPHWVAFPKTITDTERSAA